MNAAAQALLDSFDDLPDDEQYRVTIEILRRATRLPSEALPEEGLIAAADHLFRELDAREAGDAGSAPR